MNKAVSLTCRYFYNILFMKSLYILLVCSFSYLAVNAQAKETIANKPDPAKTTQTVEAACGQCQFGLPGKDCELAVRVNGKAYYVDGTNIDSHGDAHAKDGFCNAIRKAEVQGEVVDGRFKATYFKVLKSSAKRI
jgi:hypothetical protein